MDWKACVAQSEKLGIRSRFDWPTGEGFDCNPTAFTFNDVWGGISWVWTYPGDFILSSEPMRSFFELGNEPIIGSWISTILAWFLLFLITSGART
jgi:hypothetical protein